MRSITHRRTITTLVAASLATVLAAGGTGDASQPMGGAELHAARAVHTDHAGESRMLRRSVHGVLE